MWLGGAHAWASPFMPPQPGHGRRVQYESLGAACVRGHQSSCIEGTGERGPIQGLARRAVAAGLSPTAALSPRRVQVTVRPGPAVHGGGSVLTSALTAAGALPGCTSMRPGPLLTETPEVAACASCPRSHKGRQSRDPDSSPLCGGLGRRSCPPHTGESPFLGAISHFPLRCAPPAPPLPPFPYLGSTRHAQRKEPPSRHRFLSSSERGPVPSLPPPSHPRPERKPARRDKACAHQAGRRFLYAARPEPLEHPPLWSSPPPLPHKTTHGRISALEARGQNPGVKETGTGSQRPLGRSLLPSSIPRVLVAAGVRGHEAASPSSQGLPVPVPPLQP